VTASTLLLSGASRAAAPEASCGVGPAERTQIRELNTRAKQEFEEENYLAAAQQWLQAQAVLRGEEETCFVQRSTRVDLALRAYRGYRQARSFAAEDRARMTEAAQLLAAYLAEARRRGPDDERLAQIDASRGELECLAGAEAEATGVCLGEAAPVVERALPPAPPVVFLQAAPARPITPSEPPPPPRGLQIGLGVGLGVGVAATAAALATWAQARSGGPMHREIRDAAAASVADDRPDNDVSPTLSADQDYCVVARAGEGAPHNAEIAGLCDRHDRMRDASIAMTAIAGVGAVASVVFAALLVRHRKTARARAASVQVVPLRGGIVVGGGWSF